MVSDRLTAFRVRRPCGSGLCKGARRRHPPGTQGRPARRGELQRFEPGRLCAFDRCPFDPFFVAWRYQAPSLFGGIEGRPPRSTRTMAGRRGFRKALGQSGSPEFMAHPGGRPTAAPARALVATWLKTNMVIPVLPVRDASTHRHQPRYRPWAKQAATSCAKAAARWEIACFAAGTISPKVSR